MIRDMQKSAVLRNPNMAAATLVGAQADAMRAAAENRSAGPMMAFAGMNMAQNAGGFNAAQLYQMGGAQAGGTQDAQGMQSGQSARNGQSAPDGQSLQGGQAAQNGRNAQPGQASESWTCSCGAVNTGKFCSQCGEPRPASGWTCSCGAINKGNFCTECGKPRPAGAPLYRCDKCGWEPEDPAHPPKFCPECGDPFNDGDVRK